MIIESTVFINYSLIWEMHLFTRAWSKFIFYIIGRLGFHCCRHSHGCWLLKPAFHLILIWYVIFQCRISTYCLGSFKEIYSWTHQQSEYIQHRGCCAFIIQGEYNTRARSSLSFNNPSSVCVCHIYQCVCMSCVNNQLKGSAKILLFLC